MIALCAEHHNFADGGTYTVEYLRNLKEDRPQTPARGRLPWNSSKFFVMFGGNYFVTSRGKTFAFRVDGRHVFSLGETDEGYLSMNATIWNASGDLICEIIANDIIPALDTLGDLHCSAQGKEIEISSPANDASLKLRCDRVDEKKLIDGIRSKWPTSFTSAVKTDKTNKVREFIHSALDGEGVCPVIRIRADIRAATVPIRTLGKGITTDFRSLGYDKATLTGADAGEGAVRIVYGRKEMIFMGNE
jgi:hypothetical protein